MTKKRAHARSHSHGQKQADHGFASIATTSLIETLRGLGFDDPYIAASLLAGAKSLIRQLHNKAQSPLDCPLSAHGCGGC